MQKQITLALFAVIAAACSAFAQPNVPLATMTAIIKAEDARNVDGVLPLLEDKSEAVRMRAALAAGRIGNIRALPALSEMAASDAEEEVRSMAVFALGEIESIDAAEVVMKLLADPKTAASIRAASVEAAGKIGAANAKDEKRVELGDAAVKELNAAGLEGDRAVILSALTAVLRLRPAGGDAAAAKMLNSKDERIRADAANTLARLRAKNASKELKDIVLFDTSDTVRINAIRALAAAEDVSAINGLREAAVGDKAPAVRMAAIGALGRLKDKEAVVRLLEHGNRLLVEAKKPAKGTFAGKNELLELAAALGTLLEGTNDPAAIKFLAELRSIDKFSSPETEIAYARIAPEKYVAARPPDAFLYKLPWAVSAYAAGLTAIAEGKNEELKIYVRQAAVLLAVEMGQKVDQADAGKMLTALPDVLRAIAAFKPDNLDSILRIMLTNEDTFIRAAAAELIAKQPYSKENMEALEKAWAMSMVRDKMYDDAQLAIMDAAFELDKKASMGMILTSLNFADYLVRKKAFEYAKQADMTASPGIPTMLEIAYAKKKDQVQPYSAASGTRLGQTIFSDAEYRAAAAMKNGSVNAVITTEKGTFTIKLLPEDAPLTVANFIGLAKVGYFNGLAVHRVVPNFVMQDGDNRGDGNGGPGFSTRCEINRVAYERGSVGMALSGKDTGGSQWFATHLPTPHLDGGYTVFGQIDEAGMAVVDLIARGDKILSVRVTGPAGAASKTGRSRTRR
mgnify:CR=1 FL=1